MPRRNPWRAAQLAADPDLPRTPREAEREARHAVWRSWQPRFEDVEAPPGLSPRQEALWRYNAKWQSILRRKRAEHLARCAEFVLLRRAREAAEWLAEQARIAPPRRYNSYPRAEKGQPRNATTPATRWASKPEGGTHPATVARRRRRALENAGREHVGAPKGRKKRPTLKAVLAAHGLKPAKGRSHKRRDIDAEIAALLDS